MWKSLIIIGLTIFMQACSKDENCVEKIKQDYGNKIETSRDQGVRNLQKTQDTYAHEVKRAHQFGETQVKRQKTHHEQQVQYLNESYESELKKKEKHSLQEEIKALELHQQKLEQQKKYFDRELINQEIQFKDAYASNAIQNERALSEQRALLVKSLEKDKKEVMGSVGQYQDKSHDPFYRINETPTRFSDFENYYLIETEIPEHEKDNIDVRVQKNQVLITGSRKYEDRLSEDERKLETNSFQTYREQIRLDHPVNEKAIHKKFEDGVLKVMIPKIGRA